MRCLDIHEPQRKFIAICKPIKFYATTTYSMHLPCMSTVTGRLDTVSKFRLDTMQVYSPESLAVADEILSTLAKALVLLSGITLIRSLSFTAVPL